jgi:hypothetical protein
LLLLASSLCVCDDKSDILESLKAQRVLEAKLP